MHNRNWKRLAALLICAVMLLTFGGCKDAGQGEDTTGEPTMTVFALIIQEETICRQYGTADVTEDKAIDGQTRLLEKAVFDLAAEMDISSELAQIPSNYFAEITGILEKHQVTEKYAESALDHDSGYYGMAAKPEEAEADSESKSLVIHIEFSNGKKLRIDTKKPSQIEGMSKLVNDLVLYHDSVF